MPTDEELQAAVKAAVDQANADAEAKIKAAASGKFTQEDMDRVAGDARKDGRSSAEKELLKKFGVENLEAIESVVQAAREAEEANKTELQKAQEEAARLRSEAEAAKAEAHRALITSSVSLALRDAGINPERAGAALRLVDTSKLAVEGENVTGIEDAVKELQAQSPEWFGQKFSPPNASGPGPGPVNFKDAPADQFEKELARYGLK